LLIEPQLSAINALQDRHRDRQLVNAMHREMLVGVQVRRFARLEELGRDADAAFRCGSNLFELTWQAMERECGSESDSKKEMSHPRGTLAGNCVFNKGQSLISIARRDESIAKLVGFAGVLASDEVVWPRPAFRKGLPSRYESAFEIHQFASLL
jgi:hypothetical protein